MDKIKLKGHDRSSKWLEKVSDKEYQLCGDNVSMCWATVMDGYDNRYYHLDPPGGPSLYIDNYIPGTDIIIDEIYTNEKGFIIKIK